MSLVSVNGISVEFGGEPLLSDVTFAVERGERWGIVGRNGTGKTTLFRLLLGELQPSRGSIARASGLRLAYLEQHRDTGEAETVWEAAAGPFAELLALERSLAEQAAALGKAGVGTDPRALARYDRDLERFQREGGYTFAPRIDAVLHGLGFDPQEARTRPLSRLSGGERGRLGLARQLVAPADLLLLDEPTNHLDLETTLWLESHLSESPDTLLLVSHDRAFLEGVVDHVLHLESGTAVTYRGRYSDFVRQRTERRLTRQRAFDKQQAFIAAEQDFIRRNIAGQSSRQAKGRRKRLERLPRLAPPPGEEGALALTLEPAERGGDQVLVSRDLKLEVGDRVLLAGFDARVRRGERVGLVGPNGAGKSTLLSAIAGERAPEGGEIRAGASIRQAWYRQDLRQVPPDRTLFEAVHDLRPEWTRGAVQSHLGRFGFSGDLVRRTAESLSGGERARLALALLALSGANLLLLDEPTNHLDVESIEAVEDALRDYTGTFVLVSHDRALLRALVGRVWVLHEGRIVDYPGSFEEWEAASAEREHAARIAAHEEEGLRRVAERRQTRAPAGPGPGSGQVRAARRAVEAAERRVAELEARVEALERELQDPGLYTSSDGVRRATAQGALLEAERLELERAIEDWAAATEALERLTGDALARS